MKICFLGVDLPEGKVKYQDERVIALDKKFAPKKVTPFYAEFIKGDSQQCDAFIVAQDHILDLLILDMEKLETRRDRTTDEPEKALLSRCLEYLEKDTPLCDVEFNEAEAGPPEDPGAAESDAHRDRRHRRRKSTPPSSWPCTRPASPFSIPPTKKKCTPGR